MDATHPTSSIPHQVDPLDPFDDASTSAAYLIGEATSRLNHHIKTVEALVRQLPGVALQLQEITQMQAVLRALDAPTIPRLRPLEELVSQHQRSEEGSGKQQGHTQRSASTAPHMDARRDTDPALSTLDAMRKVMTSEPLRAWSPAELSDAMQKVGWATEATDRVRLVTARLQKLLATGRVTRPERAQYRWVEERRDPHAGT